ncbi:MAG: hypothetical protein ACTTIV_03655 [Campylobacter sp.]
MSEFKTKMLQNMAYLGETGFKMREFIFILNIENENLVFDKRNIDEFADISLINLAGNSTQNTNSFIINSVENKMLKFYEKFTSADIKTRNLCKICTDFKEIDSLKSVQKLPTFAQKFRRFGCELCTLKRALGECRIKHTLSREKELKFRSILAQSRANELYFNSLEYDALLDEIDIKINQI